MAKPLTNEMYDLNKGVSTGGADEFDTNSNGSGGFVTNAVTNPNAIRANNEIPVPKPLGAPTNLRKPLLVPSTPITGAPRIDGEPSVQPPITKAPYPSTPTVAPVTPAVPPSSGGVISSAITGTPPTVTPTATPPSITGGSDPGEPKPTALPALNMAQTGPAASVYDLVNKYTSEDSELRQRLESKAAEYANSRGIQNSSMAAGAATGALIDGITPIATSDAGAQNQVSLSNTAATNQGKLAEFGQAGNERITGMNNANNKEISAANNATQLTAVGMNNTSAQLIADRNNATQAGIAAGNNATTLSAANIQAAASAHLQESSLAFQASQNDLSRAQQVAMQQSDFGFRQWSQITSQGQQAMTTYASQSLNITQLQIPQGDKDQMLQHLNYVYTGNPMRAFTLPPPPSYSYGSTPPPPVTTPPPPVTTPPPPVTTPPTTPPATIPPRPLSQLAG